MRIGFIGLGRMARAMAENLLKAGHTVAAFNRTRSRAEELAAKGARLAESATAAVEDAELVITMLADDAALESIVFGGAKLSSEGSGILLHLAEGAVHASMSTVSVALSRRLAAAHAAVGRGFVAAPVFGRPEAAAAGKLWVVAAGQSAAIERCRPAFEAIGQGVFVVGDEPTAANAVKLAGNFLLASMIETLAEAVTLTRKSGVDAQAFFATMNALFRSPVIENYGNAIAEQRFEPAGFALRLGLKDMRLALAAADGVSVPMPVASVVHDRFLTATARGMGEIDWSGVARLAAADAGLPD
ncbi:MAG: NAD(P)-dependent oxidoreductase [Thermoanaerobaculales bacterium]